MDGILDSDPNPNPVGLGLLCWLAFWPAAGLILLGLVQLAWRALRR